MATQGVFAGLGVTGQVRSVFLFESDKDFFFNEIHRCKPDSEESVEHWNEAQMHWLYGQWLMKEAEQFQMPVVPSRPWDTLADRIQAVVDL